MKKINKNEIYVISQPKHPLVSVIFVDTNEFPLLEETHLGLDKLRAISDLVFIFPEPLFSGQGNLDFDKFASLYQGCAYMVAADCNLGKTLFKTLKYIRHIFEKHVAYQVTFLSSPVTKDLINNLEQLTRSSVNNPILKISRLSSSDFGDVYIKPDKDFDPSRYSWHAWGWRLWKKPEDLGLGRNKSHWSESGSVWAKYGFFEEYTDLYYKDPDTQAFVDSFTGLSDFRYLLASLIKRNDVPYLDMSVETMIIGEIGSKKK